MISKLWKRVPRGVSWLCLCVSIAGCGAGSHPAAAPACASSCQDGVALRGARTMMKLAYNTVVQGKPVGAQDGVVPCLPSDGSEPGSVHVFGRATANAVQGDSFVTLSYDFQNCLYEAPPDPTAAQNFTLTVTGLITEQGTVSVQPTSTTALQIQSADLSVTGTVYDPPIDYAAPECALSVDQNGSELAGTLCGRGAGFTF